MISYIEGVVKHASVLDGNGVGWEVKTPEPLLEGERVQLFVQTEMREASITLYGFQSVEEKYAFNEIRKVPGVGPSAALALIGQLGLPALADAIAASDVKTLTTVKGVGPKVAKAVVTSVELPSGELDDVTAGLVALGVSADEAARCAKAVRLDGITDTAAGIRAALLLCSK